MTPEQRERRDAFNRLFEALPGRNIDRLHAVARALGVRVGTVRIWRMAQPPRVIGEQSLRLLQITLGAKK